MIKYLEVSNFCSFKNESVIVLDSEKQIFSESKANPVIGFAGPNASGKTNVLKAFAFVHWFMQYSFMKLEPDDEIPFEPFVTSFKEPTKFKMEFILKDEKKNWINYKYELIITNLNVIYERLDYAPLGRMKNVFERKENQVKPGYNISNINTSDLRSNCSFICYGAKFKSQIVLKTIFDIKLFSNVYMYGLIENEEEIDSEIITDILSDEYLYNNVIELLKLADLGIVDILVKTERDIIKMKEEFEDLLKNAKKGEIPKAYEKKIKKILKEIEPFEGLEYIILKHKIDKEFIEFDVGRESAGTKQFIFLIYQVLIALKEGYIMFWDEIELKIHQDLIVYIIGMFKNPVTNPNGAQLIFTFHNSLFMDFLSPEQLWFTEKDETGNTEVFSASTFKDIKNLNKKSLDNLYRIGRFGAIPANL